MESKKPSKIILQNLLEEYQNSNYELAEKLALSIIEEFPNHQFAWTVVGAVYKQIGKLEESILANKNAVDGLFNQATKYQKYAQSLDFLKRNLDMEDELTVVGFDVSGVSGDIKTVSCVNFSDSSFNKSK